ncbi:hypothetical protein K437DRAFT_144783 [Tilletiaria anomala UBC 951]|uniref:Uncharacterized protein n=1 Tax=Tilletiaria anomala (strain ATCC 24038 / CBS 436.72 / UBC 951) TaxID=1037660 RepID=A0A066VYM6_TILAU|nr:uncharacterized protein K437DRAFT_144783 [Tilletiaria anomala UBC 951]KDN43899.1 hypothetical protein K437DRAFT_144783 [Tilletiaria anomala UBC 951]
MLSYNTCHIRREVILKAILRLIQSREVTWQYGFGSMHWHVTDRNTQPRCHIHLAQRLSLPPATRRHSCRCLAASGRPSGTLLLCLHVTPLAACSPKNQLISSLPWPSSILFNLPRLLYTPFTSRLPSRPSSASLSLVPLSVPCRLHPASRVCRHEGRQSRSLSRTRNRHSSTLNSRTPNVSSNIQE